MRSKFFFLTFLAFGAFAQAATYSGQVKSGTSYFATQRPWKQCAMQILKNSSDEESKNSLKVTLMLQGVLVDGQPISETEQLTLTPEAVMLGYQLAGYDYGFQTKPVYVEDQKIIYHYLVDFKNDGSADLMILRDKSIPDSFYGSTATLKCPMVQTEQ